MHQTVTDQTGRGAETETENGIGGRPAASSPGTGHGRTNQPGALCVVERLRQECVIIDPWTVVGCGARMSQWLRESYGSIQSRQYSFSTARTGWAKVMISVVLRNMWCAE